MSDASVPEFNAGWETQCEKLRCMIALDDGVGELLSNRAGSAFFRAFITEDRATGTVSMKLRWKYKDPDERNWYRVSTDKRGAEAVECLRAGMANTLTTALSMITGLDAPKDTVHVFYPPDDGGDPEKTIIWLCMKDLIEIREEVRV